MNRFAKAATRLDIWLIKEIFMPLAWYVDWRWHRSPYQQAAAVLTVAAGMNVGQSIVIMLRATSFYGYLPMFCSGVMVWSFRFWFQMLDKAQRQFEHRPDLISHEQMFFIVPMMPFSPRLFFLVAGMQLDGLYVVSAVAYDTLARYAEIVLGLWMVVMGIALYLAAALPPLRPRRKKKRRMVLAGMMRPLPIAG